MRQPGLGLLFEASCWLLAALQIRLLRLLRPCSVSAAAAALLVVAAAVCVQDDVAATGGAYLATEFAFCMIAAVHVHCACTSCRVRV